MLLVRRCRMTPAGSAMDDLRNKDGERGRVTAKADGETGASTLLLLPLSKDDEECPPPPSTTPKVRSDNGDDAVELSIWEGEWGISKPSKIVGIGFCRF